MRVLVTGGAALSVYMWSKIFGANLDDFNHCQDPAIKRRNAATTCAAVCEGNIRDASFCERAFRAF